MKTELQPITKKPEYAEALAKRNQYQAALGAAVAEQARLADDNYLDRSCCLTEKCYRAASRAMLPGARLQLVWSAA